MVTGSGDSSTRTFDAATGTELVRLNHDGPVWAVAFSPDGTRMATGSGDGSTRVFDAATGAVLVRLDHDGPVLAVAFTPDGTQVATASADRRPGCSTRRPAPNWLAWTTTAGCVRWRSARRAPGWPPLAPMHGAGVRCGRGAELARLDHDGPVRAVAFAPDGTRVATASADRSSAGVRRRNRHRTGPPGPRRPGTCGGVRPDGTRVATASADRSTRVFDAATGTELARLDHDGRVRAVAFSPDGTRVATASIDGSPGCSTPTPAPNWLA